MKKNFTLSIVAVLIINFLIAQNVGIKTTTPQSALDINGDLALRKGTLNLPAGGNNNVDISTSKYSVYDFAGGALAGAQIYGFTGGTDGRIVTIFNNSTTGVIQLMDESNPGSGSSLPANRIVTGSGSNAIIYQSGSATLRYDGQKQRWTIISSNYTDGLSLPAIAINFRYAANTSQAININTNIKVNFDSQSFLNNSSFNNSTFTVPASGIYNLSTYLYVFGNSAGRINLNFYVNGILRSGSRYNIVNGIFQTITLSDNILLSAGDLVTVVVNADAAMSILFGESTFFTGHKIN